MEKKKFRFKLNLFDGIVLVLALCAVAVLGYMTLKPAPAQEEGSAAGTVRFTVRLDKVIEGVGAKVQLGDELEDTIKNYRLGKVVGVEVVPYKKTNTDSVNKKSVSSVVEGYESVLITVEGSGSMGTSCFVLDGGYDLRVNATMYLRGHGYMGSGPVVAIEREGE